MVFTLLILFIIAFVGACSIGASLHYSDNPLISKVINEGPYIFYDSDSTLSVNYINGSRKEGYLLSQEHIKTDTTFTATCYFPIDSSSFDFVVNNQFNKLEAIYNGDSKILAISDIESGYKAFRDFLINAGVIDKNLEWTFEKGHLVLVGDFVDRGNSTFQVLWFIYKLEQEAQKHGGFVHYILGNHELKNMHGDFGASSERYFRVASVLEKQQNDLYSPTSFIGKWLASKNAVEMINGNLFVHGGISPELSNADLSLDEINTIIKNSYHKIFYPKPVNDVEQQLNSTMTGPCWYRGYFKENLSQAQIDDVLNSFGAKSVVVGHTLQSKVNRQYNGKVIGIDVHHPKDYKNYWPRGSSEGLLIEGEKYYRVLSDGSKKEI